jgi:hypothetical protein
MFKNTFHFGGYLEFSGISVSSKTFFTDERGYGFLCEKSIPKSGDAMGSVLGGGFSNRSADCDTQYEEKAYDTDCGVAQAMPHYPLRFKAVVPENGVYRVTLKIACPDKAARSLMIYTMRAQFMFLLFKALRMAPKSCTASLYPDVKSTDWESDLISTSKSENLIDETSTPNNLFRPDDFITGEEAVSMIVRALQPKAQRELPMEKCLYEAERLGLYYEGFEAKSMIPRGKIYRLLVSMMELSDDSEKEMPSCIEVHLIG